MQFHSINKRYKHSISAACRHGNLNYICTLVKKFTSLIEVSYGEAKEPCSIFFSFVTFV